eukprot:CAMPEP_0202866324 /NCGR_PEP_ID=MMETSP1391-20130828/7318_1 /ASSEMBLY_ACC=CAM_ASM_000867 /TAXON_ID=1034604 /ORGANISM="Chlamydomonas leiostraca, Strain SAG 11-49" /LENGTH=886 /DNA_ID=CAMNT_0049546257 /DNA_START=42 /DNA_END=2702 /DNA_ORIENTATION=+
MAAPGDGDQELLLKRAVTFKAPKRTYNADSSLLTKVLGTKNAANNRVSESLDYEPIQNKILYDRMRAKKDGKKKLYGYTGHTLAKFIVTCVTGVICGCVLVALTSLVAVLMEWKLDFIQNTLVAEHGNFGERFEGNTFGRICVAFLKFWLFGSVLVSIATAMVQYWAPAAAGAGVTLVMAYLNGNHIPNLLRVETLITKFVGTVCSVSAGLPMGPEGPMVHIGACVASVVTYLDCKYVRDGKLENCFGRFKLKQDNIKDKLKVLDEIVSDTDHREFVSAGVCAGISAAFNAPIGGVLFSMEEACSFWSRKTAWRCFIAATLSTFTIQVLNRKAVHGAISPEPGSLKPMEMKDWGMQLPFFLLDFVMAGLLGAAFNSLRMWLWKLRAAKTLHIQRILEVVGLVFLVGLCGFFFGWAAGKCIELPEDWWIDEAKGKREYGVRFFCSETEHNDIATLFLSSTHHTIVKLFSMGRIDAIEGQLDNFIPHFSPGSMALYGTIYLILMSIGAGLAIPGGLFMPSIVLGATWGGMWGILVRMWLPDTWNVQPGLYAMLAATGVLGGVFRSAISLVVLMVEGTQSIQYLPGVILAVVVANWVAHHIHHDGVYESELERIGNVYMLRDEAPHRLHTLTTEAIMATGVVGLRSIENVGKILEVMRNTAHNGFPVYVRDDDPESGEAIITGPDEEPSSTRLEGLILRSQLLVLLQRRHFCDSHGDPVGREPNPQYELDLETEMRTFFRRYYTHSRYLSATNAAIDSLQLENARPDLESLYLDLRPYMNRAPFTIRKDCSAARAHQVFVCLGLRHLIVVDAHNDVVGIITRKDLDHAAGHGWWRMSHQAEPPKNPVIKGFQASMGFLKNLVTGSTSNLQAQASNHTQPAANGHAHGGH